ncbi:membrane protein [Psychrosphaera saromensis]|uniref:Urease-associated protein n=1 Tax=Psychrosphaera saromensis TaxID=716813 RepID=A0A2S7URX8_9GAMM|nr:TIGR02117 family protein [Psychrosphaera saromensis]PQJ52498.1 hypothetical protein BTO11_01770 [Psychrosphaera saromensis]GHB69000.1 membrane protein [Psychrosphaera saromensis]GLQ12961.1 membrane protein [Psychrosphaera saromensis]
MRYLTALFVIVFLSVVISTCSTEPNVIESPEAYSGLGDNQVYVVSHGWHTSLIVPTINATAELPELAVRFPRSSYIEFGWGDKGFYQAKEITAGLALQAMLMPTDSVVHVVGINKEVAKFFPESDIELLLLTDDEIALLMQFISASFARDSQDSLISTQLGLYGDSQFYQGVGNYYLMNTCNKWTAKGLKSFGMDISIMFKLSSDSIMDYVKAQKR